MSGQRRHDSLADHAQPVHRVVEQPDRQVRNAGRGELPVAFDLGIDIVRRAARPVRVKNCIQYSDLARFPLW